MAGEKNTKELLTQQQAMLAMQKMWFDTKKLRMLSIFGMSQNPVISHSIPVIWKQVSPGTKDVLCSWAPKIREMHSLELVRSLKFAMRVFKITIDYLYLALFSYSG